MPECPVKMVTYHNITKFQQYYASGPTTNEGTKLMVEWTNQHGCGEDHSKMNCNVVIQYMCQSNGTDEDYPPSNSRDEETILKRVFYLRDGVSTDTQVSPVLTIKTSTIPGPYWSDFQPPSG